MIKFYHYMTSECSIYMKLKDVKIFVGFVCGWKSTEKPKSRVIIFDFFDFVKFDHFNIKKLKCLSICLEKEIHILCGTQLHKDQIAQIYFCRKKNLHEEKNYIYNKYRKLNQISSLSFIFNNPFLIFTVGLLLIFKSFKHVGFFKF